MYNKSEYTSEEGRIEQMENELEQQQTEQKKPKKNPVYDLYSLLHDLVYILAGITLIFVFCVRLVGVNGESMRPTFEHQDYLALESNVIMGELEYGDIIVARKLSFRGGEPIVKRVIATEDQHISIRWDENGVIRTYVDGVALDEDYIRESMREIYSLPIDITVPEGYLFVMGDNRNKSADSRDAELGLIHESEVLGKVLCVVFPGPDPVTGERELDRIGAVD